MLKALKDQIQELNPEALVFDWFDTLVSRTVAPENTKRLASDRLSSWLGLTVSGAAAYELRVRLERQLCLQAQAKGLDLEFSIPKLAQAMHVSLAAHCPQARGLETARFVSAFTSIELEVERSVQQTDKSITELLLAEHRRGRRIAVLSDFYFTQDMMQEMIGWHGLSGAIEHLQVSSRLGLSKRSGRAYPLLLSRLGVDSSRVLMIGDNPIADGDMARRNGISTFILDRSEHQGKALANEKYCTSWRHVKRRLDKVGNEPRVGHVFTELCMPIFFFIQVLHSRVMQSGVRDVFFLAREGQPLKRMFDNYQQTVAPCNRMAVRTHYLKTSRRAAFGISLRRLEEENFVGIFRQYTSLTAREFLKSVGFDNPTIAAIAADCEVDVDQRHETFPSSRALVALRNSSVFQTNYEKRRREQKCAFDLYLKSFGVPFDKQPFVVVDVGWKGSIQDFLFEAVRPPRGMDGYYLGLVAPGMASTKNRKHGLLFSCDVLQDKFFAIFNENRSLFEIALAADHGSILEYATDAEACGHAVCENLEENWFENDNKVRSLLRNVEENVARLAEIFKTHTASRNRLRHYVARQQARMVLNPTREELEWFTTASHRESFGVFNLSKFATGDRPPLHKVAGAFADLLKNPHGYLATSFWPRHRLWHQRLYGIGPLYAAVRKRHLLRL